MNLSSEGTGQVLWSQSEVTDDQDFEVRVNNFFRFLTVLLWIFIPIDVEFSKGLTFGINVFVLKEMMHYLRMLLTISFTSPGMASMRCFELPKCRHEVDAAANLDR